MIKKISTILRTVGRFIRIEYFIIEIDTFFPSFRMYDTSLVPSPYPSANDWHLHMSVYNGNSYRARFIDDFHFFCTTNSSRSNVLNVAGYEDRM